MIQYIKGDATNPIGQGNKAIIHICNNLGGWGAGFVKAISRKWVAPEIAYRKWFKTGSYNNTKFQLGEIQIVKVEQNLSIINMIAQNGYSTARVPAIDYKALEVCLNKVAEYIQKENCSIHAPRIGAGLAGGKWDIVEELINKTITGKVFIYDL